MRMTLYKLTNSRQNIVTVCLEKGSYSYKQTRTISDFLKSFKKKSGPHNWISTAISMDHLLLQETSNKSCIFGEALIYTHVMSCCLNFPNVFHMTCQWS